MNLIKINVYYSGIEVYYENTMYKIEACIAYGYNEHENGSVINNNVLVTDQSLIEQIYNDAYNNKEVKYWLDRIDTDTEYKAMLNMLFRNYKIDNFLNE